MQRIIESRAGTEAEGRLLADWLARKFPYLDREGWERRIADGRLSVDGAAANPAAVLTAGALVAFRPDAEDSKEPDADLDWELLADYGDFLFIRKSGNLPCHPGGRYFNRTLWALLRERWPGIAVATRLDRETSGVVLACRTPAAARFAQEALAAGQAEKRYLAAVHGSPPPAFRAEGRLVPDEGSGVRKKRRWVPGNDGPGESCLTDFETLRSVGGLSLVRALPRTGRTHQIRATLCSLGYPLAGDKLYGPDENLFLRFAAGTLAEEDRRALILAGQALHCEALALEGPGGERMEAACPAPWLGTLNFS